MSGIGEVQVTSLYHDPIGVNNRSLEAKLSNKWNIKEIILLKSLFSVIWQCSKCQTR